MIQTAVHLRYATVRGQQLFYREAGPADGPVVLLHGFPTSSSMFRQLIPRLADTYHVIAPDLLGFGLSDAPPGRRLRLHVRRAHRAHGRSARAARHRAVRNVRAGLRRSDRLAAPAAGAPVDHRDRQPERQRLRRRLLRQRLDAARAGVRPEPGSGDREGRTSGLYPDDLRWQYVNGVGDESLVDPDTWHHDHARLSRPGNDLVQLALFRDYGTNPPLYPAQHDCLRSSAVPLLAVWAEGDEIFGPDGARAFATDAVDPEIHLLPGGHFLLESATEEVAGLVRDFLARR